MGGVHQFTAGPALCRLQRLPHPQAPPVSPAHLLTGLPSSHGALITSLTALKLPPGRRDRRETQRPTALPGQGETVPRTEREHAGNRRKPPL